ncbi:MAG: insulinase family protein [Aerococcaceae bacterium]|nr:insulinase family protein [Aerococcaceae bacterium]
MNEILSHVQLHRELSTKYKTNYVMVRAVVPYDAQLAVSWRVLARMMEDGSQKITNRTDLEQRLAQLYGTELGIFARRRGQYLEFTLTTQMIRPQLLNVSEEVVQEWLDLIKELWLNQVFDHTMQERFERERAILIQEYKRQKEDKPNWAVRQLLYQLDGSDTQTLKILEKLTLYDIKTAYDKLCQHSQQLIFTHGDLDEQIISKFASSFGGANIRYTYEKNRLPLAKTTPQIWEELTHSHQTHLALAFSFQKANTLKERLTILLANALFGGSTHSQLFQEIREQQGLAYTVHSSLDLSRQLMIVTAGVHPEQSAQTIQAIQAAIASLITRLHANHSIFEHAKRTSWCEELEAHDNQAYEVSLLFQQAMLPQESLTIQDLQCAWETITLDDVMETLQQLSYVGCYVLKGDLSNEANTI